MKPTVRVARNGYGRGLYAARLIKKGEVVERSPVIVIPYHERVGGTTIEVYLFEWRRDDRALALGVGSLFNHSSKRSNVTYNPVHQTKEIIFVALRDIRKGEQLFINYGYDPLEGKEQSERKLFDQLKVKFEPPKDEFTGLLGCSLEKEKR